MPPTLPFTPAATNAEPDAPWKLKKVEMLFGVELAKVPLAVFGHNLSFVPALAPFRNLPNCSDVPDESVR
jgi:hypothetical protein